MKRNKIFKHVSFSILLSFSLIALTMRATKSFFFKADKLLSKNSLISINKNTQKEFQQAKKSIEIKTAVNTFSLGTSCIIKVIYTNLSNKNISFKEPSKTWEVKMKITDSEKSALELPFGIIENLSTNNETHRWVVEDAKTITIAPKQKYEFDYDIGKRWPERFTPGVNTLQINDMLDDDETIQSNAINVNVVYSPETFPMLLKLLENSEASYDFRLFAEKWIKKLYPAFQLLSKNDAGYSPETEKKIIAKTFSWWNANQKDVKVLEQIQKLNPELQPTSVQLASPLVAIGRFNLKVPDEMSLNYREQAMYGLNINTEPLPEGGIAVAWAKQIQEINAIKPPEGIKQALVKEFELLPGVKAAWYRDNAYYPQNRMLVVIQQWDKHILIAQRDAQEGKEDIAEMLMSSIIQSYQANNSKGFGVGDGAIMEGPSLSESTRLYLKHKGAKDIIINYKTLTVNEKSYIKEKDLDEEKGFAKATGSKLKVLKKQKRTIAGIKGQEIWLSMSTPKDGTFIRFSWDFIGVSRDATKPSISISLKTTESDLKELEKIWESLLNSITARPLAEKK